MFELTDKDKPAAETFRQILLQFAEIVGSGLEDVRSFRGVSSGLKGFTRE